MGFKWQSLKQLIMMGFGLLFFVQTTSADVRLPHVFGSHMVLQQEKPIVVWGWAQPSEKITVVLQSEQKETKANERGEWKVVLPEMKAGGPYTLTVSGANNITLNDVMIGEVWLCSGQSNMQLGVKFCLNAEQEIAAADYPGIRFLMIPEHWTPSPQLDFDAAWKVCTPATIAEGGWGGFSAAAYYFGREIHKVLGVPIGLIQSAWGGTRIEPWTPPDGFAAVPGLKSVYNQIQLSDPRSDLHKEWLARFLKDTENWLVTARKAFNEETTVPGMPVYPQELLPPRDNQSPTVLYNAMIHPLIPLPIRGAIWYQGEANAGDGMQYVEKMKALIAGWRQVWGQAELPFYYVQIAPFNYGEGNPSVLPIFWEAQATVQNVVPNTGMALTIDIGDQNDIHPKNKQDVGKRLALLALAKTYGRTNIVCTGPTYKSMFVEGDKIRVSFDNVGGGLVSRNGKSLSGFEIIDAAEQRFVKAQAEIDSATVVIYATGVKHPTAVRFGWDKTAQPNLMNREGLPAAPFRAGTTVRDLLTLNVVPEAKDYQLVYDLDLAKSGSTIIYDVDNRGKIKRPFDRIAYFLELKTGDTEIQYACVSMDAFTDDPGKIGVPVFGSGAVFQQNVANMNVFSNVSGIVNGIGIQTGNIEFWPNSYEPDNAKSVPNASGDYDFGDHPMETVANGYGSMQVHNYGVKQTIFSFNNWSGGQNADIGIGNSPNGPPDGTFAKNSQIYSIKRLRVLVRCKS